MNPISFATCITRTRFSQLANWIYSRSKCMTQTAWNLRTQDHLVRERLRD